MHIHTNLFLPIQRYRKRQLSIWVVHIYLISMVDTAVNLSPPSLVPPFANFVIASKLYSVNNPKFWIHDCKSFCTDFVISSRPDQKRLCLFTSKTSLLGGSDVGFRTICSKMLLHWMNIKMFMAISKIKKKISQIWTVFWEFSLKQRVKKGLKRKFQRILYSYTPEYFLLLCVHWTYIYGTNMIRN